MPEIACDCIARPRLSFPCIASLFAGAPGFRLLIKTQSVCFACRSSSSSSGDSLRAVVIVRLIELVKGMIGMTVSGSVRTPKVR